ncbi:hypothetical protein NC652_020022 [Populus alba x Populus x berolinensis]|nr:hypothetical protein NC652_020022 [Populus alba x Populus x berolinensis]
MMTLILGINHFAGLYALPLLMSMVSLVDPNCPEFKITILVDMFLQRPPKKSTQYNLLQEGYKSVTCFRACF